MASFTYKTLDLFGNEETRIAAKTERKASLFNDHDAFLEKFEPKKTTDDCYTPKAVYDCVLAYVVNNCNLGDCEIIRPFYPGGDYESIDYPANAVVIDNPPFSMVSKITRFYLTRGIRFFLFAPHLTLFNSGADCTFVVVGAYTTYENGARVKTSFVSNLFGNTKVIGDPNLYQALTEIEEKQKANLPKYVYPANVLMVSMVAYMVEKGIAYRLDKSHATFCKQLDSQKKDGKGLFGGGFLISEKAAAEKAAAEKAAAEKAAAEKANVIVWTLSDRERKIIEGLG
jgi:hypothetical protein